MNMNTITAFYANTVAPQLTLAGRRAENLLTSFFASTAGKTIYTAYNKNPRAVKVVGFLAVTALFLKVLYRPAKAAPEKKAAPANASGSETTPPTLDPRLSSPSAAPPSTPRRSNRIQDLDIDKLYRDKPALALLLNGLSQDEKESLLSKAFGSFENPGTSLLKIAKELPDILILGLLQPNDKAMDNSTLKQAVADNILQFTFTSYFTLVDRVPKLLFEKGFLDRNNPHIVSQVKQFVRDNASCYITGEELPAEKKAIAAYITDCGLMPAEIQAALEKARAIHQTLATALKQAQDARASLSNEYTQHCQLFEAQQNEKKPELLDEFDTEHPTAKARAAQERKVATADRSLRAKQALLNQKEGKKARLLKEKKSTDQVDREIPGIQAARDQLQKALNNEQQNLATLQKAEKAALEQLEQSFKSAYNAFCKTEWEKFDYRINQLTKKIEELKKQIKQNVQDFNKIFIPQ